MPRRSSLQGMLIKASPPFIFDLRSGKIVRRMSAGARGAYRERTTPVFAATAFSCVAAAAMQAPLRQPARLWTRGVRRRRSASAAGRWALGIRV